VNFAKRGLRLQCWKYEMQAGISYFTAVRRFSSSHVILMGGDRTSLCPSRMGYIGVV